VVASLQGLAYRMQELLEESSHPQAHFLVQELKADARTWRSRVQDSFQQLSKNPAVGDRESFRNKLDRVMDRLEERIAGTLDAAAEEQLEARDAENFYRLLGAYRGMSEALVNYAGHAGTIDWARLKEEKF
jgi:hypothetical protein